MPTPKDIASLIKNPHYPRSDAYDPDWALENQMGPNVLWLAEGLTQVMDLQPGMRLLDLGCGKALSSIFLAREYGLQVWATDLWISASENWQRIRQAGLQESVFPIHAEAHSLPFADGFFDAVVSLDAYHYFGTGDLYLGHYLARLLRPQGQIGMVVPGLAAEFEHGVPSALQPYWDWEFASFHSPAWWRQRFEATPGIKVTLADRLPHGWEDWLHWQTLLAAYGANYDPKEVELLRTDGGAHLGFTRLVARRTA